MTRWQGAPRAIVYGPRKDGINYRQGRRDRIRRRALTLLQKLLLGRAASEHEARIRALQVRLILCAMDEACMHARTLKSGLDVPSREGEWRIQKTGPRAWTILNHRPKSNTHCTAAQTNIIRSKLQPFLTDESNF
eukprot:6212860-Pleurochrysis_carterae.AAC.2